MSHDAGGGDGHATTLRALYDELAACCDLRPGPAVDDAFGRLVRLTVDTPDDRADAVLAHAAVRDVVDDLRSLCVEGEYQLEVAWADRIAASADPAAELARFPYVANYRELHTMERAAVSRLAEGGARPERVAFLGSGALPLTAFLHARSGAEVDRDPAALAASRRVATALGITGLGFVHFDAVADEPGVDLASYGLVILAALVGVTPDEKSRVLGRLAEHMAPGAVLVVRSARGLRTLLYPEVDPDALAGFDVLGTVHPTGEVINSVIARKPTDTSAKAW
jgi:nicotianamine synthase